MSRPEVEFRANRQRHRFEARVDGAVAGVLGYRSAGDAVVLTHTEVDDAYEGQGVGSRLVRATLDELAGRGVAVLPECPFVQSYLRRHPELVELVPADRRSEYGLADRSA